ncbi:MAG: ParB/Srx family N-terminal domain-containing protein [Bryobacteraceae bacterium]|jgi:ParB-like chromosome segregation protein Spo0J
MTNSTVRPLQIDSWPVERLIPFARNARTHSDEQIAQLAGSIKEFGFNNPVLIDPEGGIIAGHGRVLAARKLRLSEIPVLVLAHLTDNQKRAFRLADNKLALNAGWDPEMLRLELEALAEQDLGLEKLIGFSDLELEELLGDVEHGLTDADAVPDPLPRVVSITGDVWTLGRHRLLCGDGTSQMWNECSTNSVVECHAAISPTMSTTPARRAAE